MSLVYFCFLNLTCLFYCLKTCTPSSTATRRPFANRASGYYFGRPGAGAARPNFRMVRSFDSSQAACFSHVCRFRPSEPFLFIVILASLGGAVDGKAFSSTLSSYNHPNPFSNRNQDCRLCCDLHVYDRVKAEAEIDSIGGCSFDVVGRRLGLQRYSAHLSKNFSASCSSMPCIMGSADFAFFLLY